VGVAAQLGNTTVLPNGTILAAGLGWGTIAHNNDTVILRNYARQPFYIIVDSNGNLLKMEGVVAHPNFKYPLIGSNAFSAAAVDRAGNIYFGGYQYLDTLEFPGGVRSSTNGGNGRVAGFIARLGVDCRCTTIAKASFKDSLTQDGRNLYFSYTGTTEFVDSLVWSFGDGQKKKLTSGFATRFIHTYASGGDSRKDTISVTVYGPCGISKYYKYPASVGVPNVVNGMSFQLYPNPAQHGRFTLSCQAVVAISNANIIVTDFTGRQVYQKQLHPSNTHFDEQIDLKDIALGVYFINFSADGMRMVSKVVLE
ncbi:MAG: T9SS type A sorting domain-containing protein, partial [Chitinophagaceae bacterium]